MDTSIETLEAMFRTPMPESRFRRAARRVMKMLWAALIILGLSIWAVPPPWNLLDELLGLRDKKRQLT
jgi:hypothetical protein